MNVFGRRGTATRVKVHRILNEIITKFNAKEQRASTPGKFNNVY